MKKTTEQIKTIKVEVCYRDKVRPYWDVNICCANSKIYSKNWAFRYAQFSPEDRKQAAEMMQQKIYNWIEQQFDRFREKWGAPALEPADIGLEKICICEYAKSDEFRDSLDEAIDNITS